MFSPEMAVKMLKRKKNGRKRLGQRNFRPLYIEDNIGVEMVIRVKAFFHEKPPKERRKNERK